MNAREETLQVIKSCRPGDILQAQYERDWHLVPLSLYLSIVCVVEDLSLGRFRCHPEFCCCSGVLRWLLLYCYSETVIDCVCSWMNHVRVGPLITLGALDDHGSLM